MKPARNQRGNALIEFTLIGIPLIFILISIFEISRGMWVYHTLAHAVREGTRYAIVHGTNCWPVPGDPTSNSCQVTLGQVARRIQDAGVGLMPDDLNLTFSANGSAMPPCRLSDCVANSAFWPPDALNVPKMLIGIKGTYPFRSAISMFWPGAGKGIVFGQFTFPATSQDEIQF